MVRFRNIPFSELFLTFWEENQIGLCTECSCQKQERVYTKILMNALCSIMRRVSLNKGIDSNYKHLSYLQT